MPENIKLTAVIRIELCVGQTLSQSKKPGLKPAARFLRLGIFIRWPINRCTRSYVRVLCFYDFCFFLMLRRMGKMNTTLPRISIRVVCQLLSQPNASWRTLCCFYDLTKYASLLGPSGGMFIPGMFILKIQAGHWLSMRWQWTDWPGQYIRK